MAFSLIGGIRLGGVPDQACWYRRTIRVAPPVDVGREHLVALSGTQSRSTAETAAHQTDRVCIMNRTDSTSDGMCRTDPDMGRRRMLFLSWRRGTQEVDLLLGSFAKDFLAVLDGAQLDRFGARAARPLLA
jgi:hypothetical protein